MMVCYWNMSGLPLRHGYARRARATVGTMWVAAGGSPAEVAACGFLQPRNMDRI